jgi:hypothetical protein
MTGARDLNWLHSGGGARAPFGGARERIGGWRLEEAGSTCIAPLVFLGGTGTKEKRICSPDPRWSEPHGHAQEAECNMTRAGIHTHWAGCYGSTSGLR